MAISLDECQELARDGGSDWLVLASDYAQRMLPQIFRTGDPVLEVALAAGDALRSWKIAKGCHARCSSPMTAWAGCTSSGRPTGRTRSTRSEKKIGADELPAVTQLFTEDYMVLFLLHNTLGAWWAGKVLAASPDLAETAESEDELRAACAFGDVEWTYLRFVREGRSEPGGRRQARSMAGRGRRKTSRVLDPCMGSGHFLVFALPISSALRMEEEGLSRGGGRRGGIARQPVRSRDRSALHADRGVQPRARRMANGRLPGAAALNLACSGLASG